MNILSKIKTGIRLGVKGRGWEGVRSMRFTGFGVGLYGLGGILKKILIHQYNQSINLQ